MRTDFVDTELATLDLGDRRRTGRAKRLLRRLERSPGSSFPEVFTDNAELEACYRLQNNEHVGYEPFVCAHRDSAWARADKKAGSVLVLHDTSEVVYDKSEGERQGLTQKKETQSYHAHVALAVAEDELPVVHGVVGLLPTIIRDGTWFEVTPEDDEDELWVGSQRWGLLAEEVRQTAPDERSLIHVMDREADDYALFALIQEQGDNFVIRSKHDRTLVGDDSLWMALHKEPVLVRREVLVSKRGGKRLPGTKKTHPDRRCRKAVLTIRARAVTLARPDGVAPVGTPTMALWVVEAVEQEPPKGQPAVYWRLLSTLPASDADSALRIIDIYRKRWLIEEFFKSLKTGCALTKRQARTRGTLLVILAMMLPLAWRLLATRTMEREAPKTPASDHFDPIELKALRKLVPKARLVKNPTLERAIAAIAMLGGHRKQNGRPGWLTLGRGMERLLDYAEGWKAALEDKEE
ncbi:MAG: IS4 family transposase [bacterium]|nr:IS4 family transposase [bacterium]